MICPYCDIDMKKGQIESDESYVRWQPVSRKRGYFRNSLRRDYEDTIYFGEGSWAKGGRAEAHYCSSCKIMMIPNGRENV